ncbi:hypothetical protein [Actinocrinis puniceicyclus]|uniref:hypothetical protein n=1 Tax=Actinocrinis puniceicyclus TaxID=977794 RepID=UPI0028A6E7B3|nr:hypothetical protein [Actinocrinis puniceicyclus]
MSAPDQGSATIGRTTADHGRRRTSYQQYRTTFAPDHAIGVITLTSAFFNSLADGARVTFTFRFWSGASVTYHVTKSAGAVTGSVS